MQNLASLRFGLDLTTQRLLCIWEDASERAARSDKDTDWRHAGAIGIAVIERLRARGFIEDVDLVPLPDTAELVITRDHSEEV